MADPISFLKTLRRPRLLVQAARLGLSEYNRDKVLRRLTRGTAATSAKGTVHSLLAVEANLEDARKRGDASYNVSRHIEVLVALLAEFRILSQPQPQG